MKPESHNPVAVGMGELQQRLYRPQLQQCELEFHAWLQNQILEPTATQESNWIEFLKLRIGQELSTVEDLRRLYARFSRAVKTTKRVEDERQLILNFAHDLGATSAELEKDAAAFSRWFGADAVVDRYNRRHARHEQYMAFLLDRLAGIAAKVVGGVSDADGQLKFWERLRLERVVKPLLVHDGDPRLKLAAFRCLAAVLSALTREIQEVAVDDTTLQYIYRSALQHQQDVWIQSAALELLVTLSWESFERALRQRLLYPAAGDDIFVRRRAVQLLAQHFPRLDCGQALITSVLSDPSAFVRQVLPKVAIQSPVSQAVAALEQLVIRDASPQVRAATWLEWPGLLTDPNFRLDALRLFHEVATQETNEFVLRVICLAAEQSTEQLRRRQDPFLSKWYGASREVLIALRCSAASVKVRRWASQSLEFIWSESHPEARVLRDRFANFLHTIPRGRSKHLPPSLTEGLDPDFLGRIWAIVCRADYDAQLQFTRRGVKVIRGHVFGFRWWRWWHEFRHPSPDKRQAFPHTIGRLFDGQIHVPSAIMAELAQTKVPGEPLQISAEGGWRPYLPLLDEFNSCIELGQTPKPFRSFTSEGVTIVTPPRGRKRWRALARLTWQFRQYAEKRNWLDSMQESPDSYVRALEELGFDLRFETYLDEAGKPLPGDPMVLRFFTNFRAAEFEGIVKPAAPMASVAEEPRPIAIEPAKEPVPPAVPESPEPEPVPAGQVVSEEMAWDLIAAMLTEDLAEDLIASEAVATQSPEPPPLSFWPVESETTTSDRTAAILAEDLAEDLIATEGIGLDAVNGSAPIDPDHEAALSGSIVPEPVAVDTPATNFSDATLANAPTKLEPVAVEATTETATSLAPEPGAPAAAPSSAPDEDIPAQTLIPDP